MSREDAVELDAQEIAAAAFLLRFSARPLILAGKGAVESGAQEELIRLAEHVGSPVLTTPSGKDSFPESHPLAAGAGFGRKQASGLIAESDMVIAVGTGFSSVEAGAKPELPAQMIHVDIDRSQINRVYPVRNGIVGDAKAALQKILEELERSPSLPALADARAAQAPERATRAREAAAAAEP